MYWGQVAKNFALNGPLVTRFAMDLGGGNLNFHFFPTFTLIWATFFKLFGVANWVSRLLAISFSLGSLLVFYKIAAKFFDTKTAITACLLWIATPMFIYFGKMPVHEIPLMFFVLQAFWFYLTNNFRGTVVSGLLAMLITWSGFFLVPVLVLSNKRYWILIPIAIGLFGLHLTHDYIVTGDPLGGGLKEIFLMRTSGGNLSWYLWYLKTLASWAWAYFFLLIPISIIGLIFKPNKILGLFLLFGLFYPVVFRDAASRHDYLLIYFWPFICLSAALFFTTIFRNIVVKVLIIFIAVFLYFRWDFIAALQQSSLFRESVLIGKFIKDKTISGDKVQILSFDTSLPFDGWFAGYYSDRPVVYTTNPKEINYNYKVFSYFPGGKIIAGAEINNNGTK